MKGSLCVFALLLPGGLLLAGQAGAVIDDFNRKEPGLFGSAKTELTIDQERKSLLFPWRERPSAWIECAYTRPQALPGGEVPSSHAIVFSLCAEPADAISHVSIRLFDAGGEVFQWQTKLDPKQKEDAGDGWRKVAIPVDVRHPAAHWGGKNTGVVKPPLRMGGYAFVFSRTQMPSGRVEIRDVRLVPRVSVVEPVADRFPLLVHPTGHTLCGLAVTNPLARAVAVGFSGTLMSSQGANLTASGETVVLPARACRTIPIPFPGERTPGLWRVRGELRAEDSSWPVQTAFAVSASLPPAPEKGDAFLFGVCSHTERHALPLREREILAAARTGARVLRASAYWPQIEPKAGEWRWELQDELVEAAGKVGLELQPILGFCPTHAATPEARKSMEAAYARHKGDAWKHTLFSVPTDAAWRAYVRAMASRYRGKIRLYEVWNEPDLGFWRGTTDDYIRLLRSAAAEIRAADPGAKVMTGGFATALEHAGRAANPDLQERVLAEATDAFDVHAFHQHGLFPEFRDAVSGELRRLRAGMPNRRPLCFNETAVSSAFIGEAKQAETLTKKLVYAMAIGAVGYTWYDLRDDGTDPANMEHNYGLLKEDFTPKAAFVAFRECVRRLRGHCRMGRLRPDGAGRESDLFAPVFQSPDSRVAVVWNNEARAEASPLFFRMPEADSIACYDHMGASVPFPVAGRLALLRPRGTPDYWVFKPGKGIPECLGAFLSLEVPASARAGASIPASLVIFNPTERTLVVRLSYKGETDGQQNREAVRIPPRSRKRHALAVRPTMSGSDVCTSLVRVSYHAEGVPWQGSVSRIVHLGIPVPETAPDAATRPQWTLRPPQDYHDLCAADPSLAHLSRHDHVDSSAKVWLWQEKVGKERFLRVRALVRDDRHCQNTPDAIWKGDSVQIAFHPVGAKGHFVLGAALAEDGAVVRDVWNAPRDRPLARDDFRAKATRNETETQYEFAVPLSKLGLSEIPETGLPFNLIVNDNDGSAREGFLRVAPGLGIRYDSSKFPRLVVGM